MLDVSQRVYCFSSLSMPLSAINPLIISRRPRRKTLILSFSVPLLDFTSARRLSRIAKEAHNQSPGAQIRWPECAKQKSRVALALRNDALDRYVFDERTDLVDSPHVQCLDIWAWRTRLINVYNKARVEGGGYTIDHMNLSRLIVGRSILTGDFNARSPVWDPWVAGR